MLIYVDDIDNCKLIIFSVELVSFGHHVHAYDKDQMQRGTLIERVEENVLQLENDGFIDRGIKFYVSAI